MDYKNIVLENSNLQIELNLIESTSDLLIKKYDKIISLENGYNCSYLLLVGVKYKKSKAIINYLIKNVSGGILYNSCDTNSKYYSVLLIENIFYFSLGEDFVAIDINKFEILWQIKPDRVTIFEFYELEKDFLLRGEMEIHRIDKQGNILWSYGGCDIWVNIEGLPEVTILSDSIKLIDFEGNEYQIDCNGNTLNFIPIRQTVVKKWWNIFNF